MPKVVIGSKLPNGLILTHPSNSALKVKLAGLHSSLIKGATHVTTEVDQEFWDTWKVAYADFKPLKMGAIFEARSNAEADSKAKELKNEKTGFEPISPTAGGVKPAGK